MFWKIFAKKIDLPEPEQPACKDKTSIELSWGWTASLTPEELENYSEDSPQGHDSVLTTLDMAIELRNNLSRIIEECVGNPKCSLCHKTHDYILHECEMCLKDICNDCKRFAIGEFSIYCQPCWDAGIQHRKTLAKLRAKFDEDTEASYDVWEFDALEGNKK